MTKKLIIFRIIGILLCILFGVIYFFQLNQSIEQKYPQKVIHTKELYGEGNQNLKDFELQDDGSLVSTSEDPWIEIKWEKPVDVKSVTVVLKKADTVILETWADVFLSGENRWEQQSYQIKNGDNCVEFLKSQNIKNVSDIRCDLVSISNANLTVKKIVINSRANFEARNFTYVAFIVIISILVLFQLLEWIKINLEKKSKIGILVNLIILGLEIYAFRIFHELYTTTNISKELLLWLVAVCIIPIGLQSICSCLRSNIKKAHYRFLQAFIIILSAIFNMALVEALSATPFQFNLNITGIFNLGIYLEGIILLYLVTRRLGVSLLFINISSLILSVVNHYYYEFRGEPFEWADMKMAETAGEVMNGYKFEFTKVICIVFAFEMIYILLCFFSLRFDKEKRNKRWIHAGIVQLFLSVVMISINLPEVRFWDIGAASSENGYVFAFLSYINEMQIKKPANYSSYQVYKTLSKYEVDEKESTKKPNVIVIMNESFADLPSIYHFDTNEDTLPFIHSLSTNTIKGNALVSVFGGTTANSEFEFLTGNSMAFLPEGTVPYVGYINAKQESFAWQLRENGYSVLGYHPFGASGYRRSTNYPLLGLEPFYSIESKMPYMDKLRNFISDESDFKNLIHLYEKRDTSKPFFAFNVTMQNHGGYNYSNGMIDMTIRPSNEELDCDDLDEYLSLIHKSDEAFKELVNYFKSVSEPTVILMFGDHQPGIDSDIYTKLNNNLANQNLIPSNEQQAFTSSFVIWANYDIKEKDNEFISLNYLRSYLEEVTGLSTSAYDRYLIDLRKQYPLININGFETADGKWYSLEYMTNSSLLNYENIVYNNMFDKSHMVQGFYR